VALLCSDRVRSAAHRRDQPGLFVLRGFDARAWRSRVEGRWLAAGTQRDQDVESGSVIAVTEGAQIVAYFTVQHIACR
jgi:hypothetical protein